MIITFKNRVKLCSKMWELHNFAVLNNKNKMKPYIVLILLFFSITSVAQIDYKRQFDSLTIVHKICIIKSGIRDHRLKMDQVKKEKQNLHSQLLDIQSFKLGRTDIEKETQIVKINELIEANAIVYTAATIHLTTLINDMVGANDDLKELRNQ